MMKQEYYISSIVNDINLQLEKTIFWVGAGISIASGLPGGISLTDFYIESALGKNAADYLKKIWNKANRCLFRLFNLNFPFIRLEVIIDCVDEVDREFSSERFINGFSNFLYIESSKNHIILNYLAEHNGSIIVTPNFDVGILNKKETKLDLSYGVPAFDVGGSKVFHYHGTARDIDSLGATISKIKEGLPERFSEFLLNKFREGYNLVCIGFSCSDYFDVTPFFDSIKNESFYGQAIYFDYGDHVDNDKYAKSYSMLQSFHSQKYLYNRDTTKFLSEISKCSSDAEYKFDWQMGFSQPNIELQKFYLVKILNRLGLKLKRGYLLDNTVYGGNKKKMFELLVDYLYSMDIVEHLLCKFLRDTNKSVISDVVECSEIHHFVGDKIDSINHDLNVAFNKRRGHSPVREIAAKKDLDQLISDILDQANVDELIKSENVQSLNITVKHIITLYLKSKNNKYDIIMERLYECTKKLTNIHFSKFMYMSYYLSLTKSKWRLEYILFERFPNKNEIKNVVNIALEFGSLSETVKLLKCIADIYKTDAAKKKSVISCLKYIYWSLQVFYLQKDIIIHMDKSNKQYDNIINERVEKIRKVVEDS